MLNNIISASLITNAVNNLTHKLTDLITNYEVVSESSARSSHGRTTTTTTTTLRRKPTPPEPKKERELLVEPIGWKPLIGAPCCERELWGIPKWDPRANDYIVHVKKITDDMVIEEYDMLLKTTVHSVVRTSARRMRMEAAAGKDVFVPFYIERTRKLIKRDDELKLGDLMVEINELYEELNDLVVASKRGSQF